MEVLAKRGSRLGGNSCQYLLRFLGRDSFILTNDLMLCLRDSGVPISEKGTSKKDLKLAQAQINEWAEESGPPPTHNPPIPKPKTYRNQADNIGLKTTFKPIELVIKPNT